jgi:hypothetical protein
MILSAFLFLLIPAPAHAEEEIFFLCGKGRDLKHAEIALTDDIEATTNLYLNGKALGEDEFDVAIREDQWIVTVRTGGKGDGDRKFVFHGKKMQVQEYQLISNEKQKLVGAPKPCRK